jgi:hypothetical protein
MSVIIDVTNSAVCTNPAHCQRRISSVGNHKSVDVSTRSFFPPYLRISIHELRGTKAAD